MVSDSVKARIQRELGLLREGQQIADFFDADRAIVIYRAVRAGRVPGLPETTDVAVPVPAGYPAALIDLAGLPVGSPFLCRVKGGTNPQGVLEVDGVQWQLASYHPHQGGGGVPWNQNRHGFHTYLDHLLAWLDRLS